MTVLGALKNFAVETVGKTTDALRIGNGLDARELQPVGWFAHEQAVATLRASYEAIPPGENVRLAKKTSNLFRGRNQSTAPGLDVSGLGGVIAVDPVAGTADVQGMCTYEDLVDTVLPYGYSPTVVPQLKTITLGGAVTGLGVEAACFRNGLPHEALIEMDVLTGTGEVVTCSPTQNVDLFRGFPNSYGSLGYAVRLKIELEKVKDYVELRHVRFHDVHALTEAMEQIVETGEYDGEAVDYLDGAVFSLEECYLMLGRQTDEPGPTSDYTRDRIYYRSIQHPEGVLRDRLSIRDYLWRWDVDWFWASRAFGTQNPTIRRMWPRDLLRSSFYWRSSAGIANTTSPTASRPPIIGPPASAWCRTLRSLRSTCPSSSSGSSTPARSSPCGCARSASGAPARTALSWSAKERRWGRIRNTRGRSTR